MNDKSRTTHDEKPAEPRDEHEPSEADKEASQVEHADEQVEADPAKRETADGGYPEKKKES